MKTGSTLEFLTQKLLKPQPLYLKRKACVRRYSMNRLITVTAFLLVFVAQAIPCVTTGMKRVLIKCCGNPFSLNVCSTGGSGKCEEGYVVQCGLCYVIGGGACLSSSVRPAKSAGTDMLVADVSIGSSANGSQCNSQLFEDWVHTKNLDRQP